MTTQELRTRVNFIKEYLREDSEAHALDSLAELLELFVDDIACGVYKDIGLIREQAKLVASIYARKDL